jgi:hypothetical protein
LKLLVLVVSTHDFGRFRYEVELQSELSAIIEERFKEDVLEVIYESSYRGQSS